MEFNKKTTEWKNLLIEIFSKVINESTWNGTINMFYFKGHLKFTKEEYLALDEIMDEVLDENSTTLEKDERIVLVGKLRKIHKNCVYLPNFDEYLYDDVLTMTHDEKSSIEILISSFLKRI